jgi:hypothetical protein
MQAMIVALAAVSWIGVGLLCFFLWKIARFYERSSGESARAWLFALPMVLLPAGAACHLLTGTSFVGVPAGDLLLFAGGVILVLASSMLQQIMVGGQ